MHVVIGDDHYLGLIGISQENLERAWLRCNKCGHLSNSVRLSKTELQLLYDRFRDQEWRHESPNAYFDRITLLEPSESENYQKMQLIIRELGPTMPQSIRRMLDIGCGAGVLIHTAKQLLGGEWSFYGIEPTASFADLASKRTSARVVAANYSPGIFGYQQFDLATCCQVLEHIEKPREFLNGIRSDLRDGGYLYLEVPDLSDFGSLKMTHDRFMSQHISYFSSSTLSSMLEESSFSVVANEVTRTVRGRNNLWFFAQAI